MEFSIDTPLWKDIISLNEKFQSDRSIHPQYLKTATEKIRACLDQNPHYLKIPCVQHSLRHLWGKIESFSKATRNILVQDKVREISDLMAPYCCKVIIRTHRDPSNPNDLSWEETHVPNHVVLSSHMLHGATEGLTCFWDRNSENLEPVVKIPLEKIATHQVRKITEIFDRFITPNTRICAPPLFSEESFFSENTLFKLSEKDKEKITLFARELWGRDFDELKEALPLFDSKKLDKVFSSLQSLNQREDLSSETLRLLIRDFGEQATKIVRDSSVPIEKMMDFLGENVEELSPQQANGILSNFTVQLLQNQDTSLLLEQTRKLELFLASCAQKLGLSEHFDAWISIIYCKILREHPYEKSRSNQQLWKILCPLIKYLDPLICPSWATDHKVGFRYKFQVQTGPVRYSSTIKRLLDNAPNIKYILQSPKYEIEQLCTDIECKHRGRRLIKVTRPDSLEASDGRYKLRNRKKILLGLLGTASAFAIIPGIILMLPTGLLVACELLPILPVSLVLLLSGLPFAAITNNSSYLKPSLISLKIWCRIIFPPTWPLLLTMIIGFYLSVWGPLSIGEHIEEILYDVKERNKGRAKRQWTNSYASEV